MNHLPKHSFEINEMGNNEFSWSGLINSPVGCVFWGSDECRSSAPCHFFYLQSGCLPSSSNETIIIEMLIFRIPTMHTVIINFFFSINITVAISWAITTFDFITFFTQAFKGRTIFSQLGCFWCGFHFFLYFIRPKNQPMVRVPKNRCRW